MLLTTLFSVLYLHQINTFLFKSIKTKVLSLRSRCLFISLFIAFTAFAQQETVIKGRVTERGKPESLPFVSIYFKGTQKGTSSDFEGNFTLKTSSHVDSIVFSYIGYKTLTRKVQTGKTQMLNIELVPDSKVFQDVIIVAGVNPALRIVKKAAENKSKLSQNAAKNFEYDSYSKVDMSMNNISEKLKNSTVFKPLKTLFDTANQIQNEEGKYILPIFISEAYSRYYQSNSPPLSKEIVKASDINGFLAEQGNFMVDMLGANSLEFNFNQNWIRFLYKDFLSPIADGGSNYYIYTLTDSVEIDGLKCYKIKLNLRREEDLGFLGTMWIADSSFALKRVDVEISSSANINFLDRLKIQQELVPTDSGFWIPSKTRAIIDIAKVTENASSFIAKMYRSNSNFSVNQNHPPSFYDILVERDENMLNRDSAYWDSVRTEPFSVTEKQMISMIDSVKNVPVVKTYLDIIQILAEGYFVANKIDIGPNIFLVGYNEVEHLRVRLGFKTNNAFSRKWYLNGYLAYGFGDEKFKYGMGANRLLSHKYWTIIGASHKNDYEIMGISDASSMQLHNPPPSNAFTTLSFLSSSARLNKTIDYRLFFTIQPTRNWTVRTTFQNTFYEAIGSFVFAYKFNPDLPSTPDNISSSFTYTAATIEARFAYKEVMIERGIDRIRMRQSRIPAITFLYSKGMKGVLNGEFDYQKFQVNIQHHLNTGIFGTADMSLTLGKVLGTLPYPLLEIPRGSSTAFYSDLNFGLMNLYEFASDEYYSFRYIQHFEGLFFNSIPVISKWKLRNYGLVKGAYGSVSQANKDLFSPIDAQGRAFSPVYEFKNEPYIEVGYGIENLFRFMTLGAVHRLNYLNNTNARKFGINIGIIFQF